MKSSAAGRVYDLASLFDRLNRLYFDGTLNLQIRWSARSTQRARRRILLGTYCDKTRTITLSKRLDNLRVPLFFVEHILFHEMLHSVFPREKHRMHTEKFKKFEKLHPDYDRALAWEKESTAILFSSAQTILPIPRQKSPNIPQVGENSSLLRFFGRVKKRT